MSAIGTVQVIERQHDPASIIMRIIEGKTLDVLDVLFVVVFIIAVVVTVLIVQELRGSKSKG